jgi:hypothetical protein
MARAMCLVLQFSPIMLALEQLGKSFYILGGVLQLAISNQSDTGDITNFTI